MTFARPAGGGGRRLRLGEGDVWPEGAAAAPATRAPRAPAAGRRWPPLPLTIFVVSLLLPWQISLGPLSLSPTRIVLLILVVPCVGIWLSGRAGRLRLTDVLLVLFWLWCSISLVAVHGLGFAIQPSGILFIETMGAYLVARCFIRDLDGFRAALRLLFLAIAALLPFAVLEAVTGRNILLEALGMLLPTYADAGEEARFGLRRAQTVFEHPILYGAFPGSILALVHLVLGHRRPVVVRWSRSLVVGAAAVVSLSSGPLLAVVIQVALMSWERILRAIALRWKLLIALLVLTYVPLELVSNRSVPELYISYFTFSQHTSWYRILIWQYGIASVLAHPLFGIGFHEWARASFMTSSIDAFWLVPAVRHGAPAALLLLGALASTFLLCRRPMESDALRAARLGFVIVMTSFFVVGCTVHFWATSYMFFTFLLGSGIWLFDARDGQGTSIVDEPRRERGGVAAPRPVTGRRRGGVAAAARESRRDPRLSSGRT
ncbi:O-antigen ligase family protein [Lutibaculum baratangense]|uniref:Uncharacterized protein n=1 Tax=Lutibaculum baratangense AMV1 TaxID=631454 RepID=V4RCC4_9HYPH|nr:O-antigen ligase family protein [Lutibaculum baratangense]ESR23039.1 hypothetical protein N177_3107 [Lutibaculum baratangense AMV1]